MKYLMLGLASAVLALSLVACGGDPCDDLKAQCDACTDMTKKDTCSALVTAANALPIASGDACQAHLDAKTYEGC